MSQDAIRWLQTAEAELEPVVEGAGVDPVGHARAALLALASAVAALEADADPEQRERDLMAQAKRTERHLIEIASERERDLMDLLAEREAAVKRLVKAAGGVWATQRYSTDEQYEELQLALAAVQAAHQEGETNG